MILTNIQNLILSKIRSNPALIDKDEHADVEDALLQNSYGTVINETQSSNTITNQNANPLIQYNIFICKQGRKVTIKGNLFNNSAFIIGGEANYFFEIVDAEYQSNIGVEGIGGAPSICATFSGATANVYLYNQKLCFDSLGAYEVVFLNFEYLTEN